MFARARGTTTVYLLTLEDGGHGQLELVKRRIPDPQTFAVMGDEFGVGGRFGNVRDVDPRHLARVREGERVRSLVP